MPDATQLHTELAKAAVSAATPEPPLFVRLTQLLLAAVALGGALAIALILVLSGPPAPKVPTGGEEAGTTSAVEGEGTAGAFSGSGTTARALVSESGEGGEAEGGAEGQSGEEEEEAEDGGESLADLSKQGPWAFAIVALLVAAFIATGKSLNFSGGTKD
jgi:hypothetical protein